MVTVTVVPLKGPVPAALSIVAMLVLHPSIGSTIGVLIRLVKNRTDAVCMALHVFRRAIHVCEKDEYVVRNQL